MIIILDTMQIKVFHLQTNFNNHLLFSSAIIFVMSINICLCSLVGCHSFDFGSMKLHAGLVTLSAQNMFANCDLPLALKNLL